MPRLRAALAPALALLASACTERPAVAPATLPAVATASTSVDPWQARLTTLRGVPLGAEAPTALADLRGTDGPTVYAFWASYCPPCLAEMPMFEAAHDRGVRIVGVSLDAEDPKLVRRLLDERGATYPNVVLDAASMKAAGRHLPGGLPFTLVLDAAGAPRVALHGKTEAAELAAALKLAAP